MPEIPIGIDRDGDLRSPDMLAPASIPVHAGNTIENMSRAPVVAPGVENLGHRFSANVVHDMPEK